MDPVELMFFAVGIVLIAFVWFSRRQEMLKYKTYLEKSRNQYEEYLKQVSDMNDKQRLHFEQVAEKNNLLVKQQLDVAKESVELLQAIRELLAKKR